MSRAIVCIVWIHLSLCASAQMKNIKLTDLAQGMPSPDGVSIAISNKDSKYLIAGVGPNRLFTSEDGGKSWTESALESSFGGAGEPAVLYDTKGNMHYFHLSNPAGKGPTDDGWMDRIVGHSSTESEDITKWEKAVSIGNNPPKDQAHPRVSRHADENGLYLAWTQFDHYGSNDSTCQSNVLFSKSSHGKKWSDPLRINFKSGDCKDGSNTASGATAAANTNGRIFVVWANQGSIYFDRSYTDGDSWLTSDVVIAEQHGGSYTKIPGIGKTNGRPTLIADNSDTFFKNSLYVCYADKTNGENDSDIWLTRSTNQGDSWTRPQRINKDSLQRNQFMPAITLDQSSGVIYAVYYDRRAYDDLRTDVYLAYSLDGTNHFSEIKISESPFIPSADKSIGDYIGITASKGIIAPIWTRNDEGRNSVWTVVIKQEELFKKEELPRLQSMKRLPPAALRKAASQKP